MGSNAAPMGENGENNLCVFLLFFGYVYGKYVKIIGLKAPGNYSDKCWSNKILVSLCEGPESNISMISGVLTPGEPLFMI